MNPDYWQKIEKLFHQALEQPENQRQSFIEEQCAGDTVLLDELKTLLKNSDSKSSIGEIVQNNAEKLKALKDPWLGQIVDQYKIIEEIAVGGMGAVYLGERTDSEYRQKVAIKLMSHGLVSKQARQRFLSERQILANLNHPNIASLLDGGTTDSGVPYLVMEYIEGQAIDKYCDKHRLNIKQRIQLILEVCSAIQYAHQNLIVHRDIKTSNILVTDDGIPKLLDFGIAKLLEHQPMEHTVALTRTEMRLLTPEYASPEQIRGEAVSTATDVYGVGILLFKLLTGYFPFMVSSYSPAELEQLICKQPPPKPSGVVAKNKDVKIAKNRSTYWKKLQREIRGDLDNIILVALSKETSRRYSTMNAMAVDLKNHLQFLPVNAQPPSFKYRFKKFVRRNFVPVSVSAGIIIAATTLISFYTWQLSEQRDIAIAAEAKAQQKADNLSETTDFIISLFTTANPRSKGNQFVTARDLLDEGMLRINQDLKTDTLSKAQMLFNLGLAYNALDIPDKAVDAQQQALKIHTKLFGNESIEISTIMNRLGDALRESGKNEEGYQFLKKALEMRQRILGQENYKIADSYNNLAMAVRNLNRLDEALAMQHKAVEMHLRVSDPKTDTIHVPLNNLSLIYKDMGNFKQALIFAQQALEEFYKRGKQTDISGFLRIRKNIASISFLMGKYKIAREAILSGIAEAEKKYQQSDNQLLISKRLLAQIEHGMGHFEVADKIFKDNVEACEIHCQKSPILNAITRKYWAVLKRDMGDIVNATNLIATSVEGYKKYASKNSSSIITTWIFQADIAISAKDYLLYQNTMVKIEAKLKTKKPSKFQLNFLKLIKAKYFLKIQNYNEANKQIEGVAEFFLNDTGKLSANYLKAVAIEREVGKGKP